MRSESLIGGESVLVNGAVFKTVSETVRTGSGRFDSYTPPPKRKDELGRMKDEVNKGSCRKPKPHGFFHPSSLILRPYA